MVNIREKAPCQNKSQQPHFISKKRLVSKVIRGFTHKKKWNARSIFINVFSSFCYGWVSMRWNSILLLPQKKRKTDSVARAIVLIFLLSAKISSAKQQQVCYPFIVWLRRRHKKSLTVIRRLLKPSTYYKGIKMKLCLRSVGILIKRIIMCNIANALLELENMHQQVAFISEEGRDRKWVRNSEAQHWQQFAGCSPCSRYNDHFHPQFVEALFLNDWRENLRGRGCNHE